MALEARFEYRHVRVDGDSGPIVTGFCAVIPPEGLTVMVGPSGAGKTTLLRLLNRLDDPDDGVVLFEGRDVREYDALELRRRVQLVGQMPVTFPGTVADNVGGDTSALLARVGLDASLAAREADRLSVGEAQRMALARSLALAPEVLALDEPTSALDVINKAGIEQLIRELADSGLTVVMVSHDPRHAELADHVIEVHRLTGRNHDSHARQFRLGAVRPGHPRGCGAVGVTCRRRGGYLGLAAARAGG